MPIWCWSCDPVWCNTTTQGKLSVWIFAASKQLWNSLPEDARKAIIATFHHKAASRNEDAGKLHPFVTCQHMTVSCDCVFLISNVESSSNETESESDTVNASFTTSAYRTLFHFPVNDLKKYKADIDTIIDKDVQKIPVKILRKIIPEMRIFCYLDESQYIGKKKSEFLLLISGKTISEVH